MKRNKKGIKTERNRNESESYPGMTGNDCENDRKRPETTAGSPFGSATSRNGFLGNSPIFPAFSSIFRAYSAKNTPGAESTEGYGYSLSSVVSFFGNIGGILLSTKTTARLITVVTPIAIAALS